ncbi:hypothetical protein PR001_g22270 [Phytophthora rubi]|uniref:Uncharacterized protein n=1 Tax=Phytophthora rubi TaxID=129364 RepID=A0A6A3J5X2_9STRA|nr:hypothetical protein PR001_g22270 [Phytophthora rubi]
MKQLVAFSPPKEPWMQNHKTKIYRCVGTAYIVGRVCRRVKKPKNGTILQVMWLYTQFQNAVEALTIATVQRSIDNYQALVRLPNKPAWRDLTDTVVEEELNLDLPLDELEIASDEEAYELWDPERFLPASLSEVEAVKSMRFEPELEMDPPAICTLTQMTALRYDYYPNTVIYLLTRPLRVSSPTSQSTFGNKLS